MVVSPSKTGNYRMDCQNDEAAIAQPFWESIQTVLPRITNALLIQLAVWHKVGCYAGAVDMVCHFDGQPVISLPSCTRRRRMTCNNLIDTLSSKETEIRA